MPAAGDVPDPPLALLRALVLLQERGGYAAAASPGVTREQLWQQVYRLEAYVNGSRRRGNDAVRLAERGRLTPAGQELLAAASGLLDAADDLRGTVRSIRGRGRTVDVACYPAHAALVMETASELRTSSPAVEVTMRAMSDELRRGGTRELLRLLRDGSTDIVIANSDSDLRNERGVQVKVLYDWTLRAVVSKGHPLFGAGTVDVQALAAQRMMTSPRGHVSRELLESTRVLTVRTVFESESVDALFALATAGWGVAVVPSDALPVRSASQRQRRGWPTVTFDGRPLGGSYAAVHRGRAQATMAVAAALQRHALASTP